MVSQSDQVARKVTEGWETKITLWRSHYFSIYGSLGTCSFLLVMRNGVWGNSEMGRGWEGEAVCSRVERRTRPVLCFWSETCWLFSHSWVNKVPGPGPCRTAQLPRWLRGARNSKTPRFPMSQYKRSYCPFLFSQSSFVFFFIFLNLCFSILPSHSDKKRENLQARPNTRQRWSWRGNRAGRSHLRMPVICHGERALKTRVINNKNEGRRGDERGKIERFMGPHYGLRDSMLFWDQEYRIVNAVEFGTASEQGTWPR